MTLAEVNEAVRLQKRAEALSPKGPNPISAMGSGRLAKPLPALPRTSYPLVVDDDNDFDASTSDL